MDSDKTTFRCLCGRSEVISWRQPPPCQGCAWCKTTLTASPALRGPVLPHDMYNEEMVISERGDVLTVEVCKGCNIISLSVASLI